MNFLLLEPSSHLHAKLNRVGNKFKNITSVRSRRIYFAILNADRRNGSKTGESHCEIYGTEERYMDRIEPD